MLVLVTLMIASLGSLMIGSATSSTETLRWPCQVTALMRVVFPAISYANHSRTRPYYDAAGSWSCTPMITRSLTSSRDSSRDTCIWLVPISSAISDWERSS
jgi:hypothetical protein